MCGACGEGIYAYMHCIMQRNIPGIFGYLTPSQKQSLLDARETSVNIEALFKMLESLLRDDGREAMCLMGEGAEADRAQFFAGFDTEY